MKKVLALVMAAMLVVGIAPMTFAASDPVGKSTPEEIYQETAEKLVKDSYFAGYAVAMDEGGEFDLDTNLSPSKNEMTFPLFLGNYYPDASTKTVEIPLVNGGIGYMYTRADVKADKLAVELRVTNGQRVVDKVEFAYTSVSGFSKDNDLVSVKIKFKDKFVSIKEVEYKFVVYLTKDKKRWKETEMTFTGKYKNQETTVDEDDVYVYLGDDVPVVESLAYLKTIDIELDDGLTVHTKFFNNKKYYANGEAKVRDDDDAVITKYPEIDQVYNIDQVGLNNSYTTVSISGIGKETYVYNADLEFVGTGDQKLPFSTKYYVSATELDVDTADVTEPSEEDPSGDLEPGDSFEPSTETGGDDVPENVNDNPGTGC